MKDSFQCECGSNHFTIQGQPILRFVCHCNACQAFTGRDYSDVTFFLSDDVLIENDDSLDYQSFSKPKMVSRGTCQHCDTPFLEKLELPLLPKMTLIPSPVLDDKIPLPVPECHVFYHRKVAACDDTLPKYSGFLKSQLVLTRLILQKSYARKLEHIIG